MPMISEELITGAVATAVGSMLSYIIGKRKSKAETAILEIEAVNKVAAIWRGLAEGLKTEVDELKKEVEQLVEENKELNKKINDLLTLKNK